MLPITLNRCVRSPPLFDLYAEAAEVLFRFLTLNIYEHLLMMTDQHVDQHREVCYFCKTCTSELARISNTRWIPNISN